MTKRTGVIHVLEAVIAAVILFFFLLVVLPSAEQDTTTGFDPDREAFRILDALDTGGSLRTAAMNDNWTQIKESVAAYLPTRTVEIAAVTLNTTNNQSTFTDSHTAAFYVNGTVDRQTLRIWYRDADTPTVSVNDQQVASLSGAVSDRYETYDIAAETTEGENTLNISVDSQSTVGYSIDRYMRTETGLPPAGVTAVTSSYLLAGINSSFRPTEVNALTWQ